MKALEITVVNKTEVPVFTKFNYSASRQTINKHIVPDGDKCYEKKQNKRTVVWGSDFEKNDNETILDGRVREEMSIKVTFEQRPEK